MGREGTRPPKPEPKADGAVLPLDPQEPAPKTQGLFFSWYRRRTSFSRSLGAALVFEALLLLGSMWVIAHHHAAPPVPAPPKRIAIHVVQPPPPPKSPPLQELTPTVSASTPMPATPSLPVIAVSSHVHLNHPAFQVPALPLPPPAVTAPQTTPNQLDRYTSMLRAATQADLRVPGMVQAMRLQGIATVLFKLAPAGGRALWAKLVHSSGIPMIDQAALAKVRSTSYPPFLEGLPQRDSTFKIAVRLSGIAQ